jgi:hypothetical protein
VVIDKSRTAVLAIDGLAHSPTHAVRRAAGWCSAQQQRLCKPTAVIGSTRGSIRLPHFPPYSRSAYSRVGQARRPS